MAPEFDDLRIDAEDVVGMAPVYRQHPVIQDLALLVVPAEALELHAASQFSKCDDREKYLATVGGGILKKFEHARVRPGALALLADDVGVDQIHARSLRSLDPREIPFIAGVAGRNCQD